MRTNAIAIAIVGAAAAGLGVFLAVARSGGDMPEVAGEAASLLPPTPDSQGADAAGAGPGFPRSRVVAAAAPGPESDPPAPAPPLEPEPMSDGRVFDDYAEMVEEFGARTPESLDAVWKEVTDLNNDIVATTRLQPEQKADLVRQLRMYEAAKSGAFKVPKVVGFTRRPQPDRPGAGDLLEVQYER